MILHHSPACLIYLLVTVLLLHSTVRAGLYGQCDPYQAAYTRGATTKTSPCFLPFTVCPGQTLTVSMCSSYGGDCMGDSMIRLYKHNQFTGSDVEVAVSDDFCDLCPQLQYAPPIVSLLPSDQACESLVIQQGCRSARSCSGDTRYYLDGEPIVFTNTTLDPNSTHYPTQAPTTLRPTTAPTYSRAPTLVPTRKPTLSQAPTLPPWYYGHCDSYDSGNSTCNILRLCRGEVLKLRTNHSYGEIIFSLHRNHSIDGKGITTIDDSTISYSSFLVSSNTSTAVQHVFAPLDGDTDGDNDDDDKGCHSYILYQQCRSNICSGSISYVITLSTTTCSPGHEIQAIQPEHWLLGEEDSLQCTPCIPGTYQPFDNYYGLCSSCPNHLTTMSPGSISLHDCINQEKSMIIGYILGLIFFFIWFFYFLRGRVLRIGSRSRFMIYKRALRNIDVTTLTLLYTWMSMIVLLLRKRYEEKEWNRDRAKEKALASDPQFAAQLQAEAAKPKSYIPPVKRVSIGKRVLIWLVVLLCGFILLVFNGLQMLTYVLITAMIMIRSISLSSLQLYGDSQSHTGFLEQYNDLETTFFNKHLPNVFWARGSNWIKYVLYPFNYIMKYFAKASIPLSEISITCEGPAMFTRLSIAIVIVIVTIVYVMSDVQVYWSVSLPRVLKQYLAVCIQQFKHFQDNDEDNDDDTNTIQQQQSQPVPTTEVEEENKSKKKNAFKWCKTWSKTIRNTLLLIGSVCIWAIAALLLIPEPRTILQYLFTFYVIPFLPTVREFFGRSVCGTLVAPDTNHSVWYAIDENSQRMILAIMITTAWPILHTLSFVLCPSFEVMSYEQQQEKAETKMIPLRRDTSKDSTRSGLLASNKRMNSNGDSVKSIVLGENNGMKIQSNQKEVIYEGQVYGYRDIVSNQVMIPLSRQNAMLTTYKTHSTTTLGTRILERSFSYYQNYLLFGQYMLTAINENIKIFIQFLTLQDRRTHCVGIQKLSRVIEHIQNENCIELRFHWLSFIFPMLIQVDPITEKLEYDYWYLQQRWLPTYQDYLNSIYRVAMKSLPTWCEEYAVIRGVIMLLSFFLPFQLLFAIGRDFQRCIGWNFVRTVQICFGFWSKANVDAFQILKSYDVARPLPAELPTEKDLKEVDHCKELADERKRVEKRKKRLERRLERDGKNGKRERENVGEEDCSVSTDSGDDDEAMEQGQSVSYGRRAMQILCFCSLIPPEDIDCDNNNYHHRYESTVTNARTVCSYCMGRREHVSSKSTSNKSPTNSKGSIHFNPNDPDSDDEKHGMKKPSTTTINTNTNNNSNITTKGAFQVGEYDYVTSLRRRYFARDIVITDKHERKLRRKWNKTDPGLLDFIYSYVSIRAIFFQLLPYGAIISLFLGDLSNSPIFVFSGELLSRLPPFFIWTPYHHTVKKLKLTKVYPTLFLPLFITMCYEILTQTRLMVFFYYFWKNLTVLLIITGKYYRRDVIPGTEQGETVESMDKTVQEWALDRDPQWWMMRVLLYLIFIRALVYAMKTSLEIYYLLMKAEMEVPETTEGDIINAEEYLIFDEVLHIKGKVKRSKLGVLLANPSIAFSTQGGDEGGEGGGSGTRTPPRPRLKRQETKLSLRELALHRQRSQHQMIVEHFAEDLIKPSRVRPPEPIRTGSGRSNNRYGGGGSSVVSDVVSALSGSVGSASVATADYHQYLELANQMAMPSESVGVDELLPSPQPPAASAAADAATGAASPAQTISSPPYAAFPATAPSRPFIPNDSVPVAHLPLTATQLRATELLRQNSSLYGKRMLDAFLQDNHSLNKAYSMDLLLTEDGDSGEEKKKEQQQDEEG